MKKRNLSKVQVVLATYNGANFLEMQLSSILEQLGDGELIVHDDGSTDGTTSILESWSLRDKRIRILNAPARGSAVANFSYLLSHTDAPYVFCADQDDVWQPSKIESMVSCLEFYQNVYGEDIPLLIHSDLTLIDEDGQIIAPSMWDYQKLNPRWGDHFNLLLTQNVVTGCAMLVNRALLNLALPIPKEVSMHDHWLALVACGQGKVVWLDEPTVLYRQHSRNEVGAKRYSNRVNLKLLATLFLNSDYQKSIKDEQSLYITASHYLHRYPNRRESVLAERFVNLKETPLALRPIIVIRHRFFMNGWFRSLGWAVKPRRYMDAAQQILKGNGTRGKR